jgi:hypothetical protein
LQCAAARAAWASVIAFGTAVQFAVSGGNLTAGNVSALAGLGDDPKYLNHRPSAPANITAVLDGSGNLIGIITAKLDAIAFAKRTGDIPQNVNFAVKAEVLETFLQSKKIPYDVAITDGRLAVVDVADMAKQAAVKIVCVPSGSPAAEPGTVRVSPRVDPLPLPPTPGEVRRPRTSVTRRRVISQQVQLQRCVPLSGSARAASWWYPIALLTVSYRHGRLA